MIYLLLYIEFFKIGLFAIGGGLATLPFLYRLAEKTNWFTAIDLTNMVAVAESTPGPLGINMSTFAGFNTAGVLGAAVATIGLVTPALICIIIIARFIDRFKDNETFKNAFIGIRPAVCGLLVVAVWEVLKIALFNLDFFETGGNILGLFHTKSLVFFIILMLVSNKLKGHPFFYIAASAVVGLFIKF